MFRSMEYYVLHVQTGKEDDFVRWAKDPRHTIPSGSLYLPKRILEIRRMNKVRKEMKPLYPGYIFWQTEGFSPGDTMGWRKVPGFMRILGQNGKPQALSDTDLEILHHLQGFGDILGLSLVTFDENDRIVVISGVMKGLEGKIVKVDKRKRRAKIRSTMNNSVSEFDLGFEILQPSERGE